MAARGDERQDHHTSGAGARALNYGASAVLTGVIMVGASLLLWIGVPAGWLWVGSQVQYWTGFVTAGITTIMVGCVASLFLTLALAKRLDYSWKLVRRAAGYEQQRGALERIFVLSVGIAVVGFSIWFFLIHGPGSSLVPGRPA